MADLNYIDRDLEVKIVGQDSTGNTVNYVSADANGNMAVKDYSDGPVTPGTVASASALIGGQFNTALPTLTTGQQSAIQVDSSGRLIISPTTQGLLAEDHNYGTVGANTLRTASQIGNATGAADFNSGATGAQTLRVQANQGAAGAAAWLTTDAADGPVTPGAVASKSMLGGGQFNTTLPTLTNGQQAAFQMDSTGHLMVTIDETDPTFATQNITIQDTATTTTAIANGQSVFTGTPTAGSAATFAVASEDTALIEVTGTWTGTLQIEVSMDSGITWFIRPIHQAGGMNSGTFGSFTANFAGGCNVAGWTNIRIRAIAAMTGTATVRVIESINANSIFIANPVRIADSNNNVAKVTANGDMDVADIVNTSATYSAVTVSTATELKVGGSRLANRKLIIFQPNDGDIYYGFDASVATTTGMLAKKGQIIGYPLGAAVSLFAIASSGTVHVRVQELA